MAEPIHSSTCHSSSTVNLQVQNGAASRVATDKDNDSARKWRKVSSTEDVPRVRKRRDRRLGRSDWEMMRQRITALYSRLTLTEVMKIMYEKDYMYKERFYQWDITIKKVHGGRSVESGVDDGFERRPSRGLHPSTGNTLPKLLHTPCSHPSETFLKCAREHTSIRLGVLYRPRRSSPGTPNTEANFWPTPTEIRLYSHLSKAHRALEAGHASEACIWVGKACDLAETTLDWAQLSLIGIFGDLQNIWHFRPDLGMITTRLFLQLAEKKFAQHPAHHQDYIIQLFRLFMDHHDSSIIEATGSIVLDTVQKVAPVDIFANHDISNIVVAMYCTAGLCQSALKIAKQKDKLCHQNLGPSHCLTHKGQVDLAEAYFQCGYYIEALEAANIFLLSNIDTVSSLHNIVLACLVAGDSSLALERRRDAMYYFCLPGYHLREAMVDEWDKDFEFLFDMIEYSDRMAYNTWRSQLSPSDLQYLDHHSRASCCPSCTAADNRFEACAQWYGWPSFEYHTLSILQLAFD